VGNLEGEKGTEGISGRNSLRPLFSPKVAAGLALELHNAPSAEETEEIRKEELRKQNEKREEIELQRMLAAKASAAGA
jgi:hypothetical protein